MKHCIACDQPVRPIKRINWPIAIVLILLSIFFPFVGVPFFILYLAYYVVLKRRECPICHGRQFRMTDEKQTEWDLIKSGRIIDIVGGSKHVKKENSEENAP